MIPVAEALKCIEDTTAVLKIITIPIAGATGYVLAEDVVSIINMPPFNQSAMDGYALHLHNHTQYTIIDEVKAGDAHQPVLQKGEAVRIFTGAPVPETANAVVMQEKVVASNTVIDLQTSVKPHDNIRPLGEQTQLGHVALTKGTTLTPAAIGYLTTLGFTKVKVYQHPKIAIVVTGNELAKPGTPLTYGKIYESNSFMLASAVESLGYAKPNVYTVKDNYNDTKNLLEQTINNNDLVLITGGISVGDYDFVGKALLELNTQQVFYKVKQKPGKPLFFGTNHHTKIFALPGNPAAALSCFYIYVNTALKRMSGLENFTLQTLQLKSATHFVKKGDRTQFLKAIYQNDRVKILEGQSSAMLQTFALANALVKMDENCSEIHIGDTVEVIPLAKL